MVKDSKKVKISSLIAKSAIRDIFQKKTRSLITIIAVMLVTAFPIAFLRTSDSLQLSLDNESENLVLAHIDFQTNVFNETLLQQIETIVNDETNNTALMEKRVVSTGATMDLEETYPVVFIGLNNSALPQVNQITIHEGELISSPDEVMILASFAKEVGLELGDDISVKGLTGERAFEIVGLVHSIEWLNFKLTSKAVLWTMETVTRELQGLHAGLYNNLLVYLNEEATVEDSLAIGEKVRELCILNGTPLAYVNYPRDMSIRAILMDVAELISRYLSVCAILTIVICGFMMYIIMNRFVSEQRSLIGVFHSFGFSHSAIIRMFLLRAAVLGVFGCILGVGTSYGILALITMILGNSWGVFVIALSIDWFTVLWVCIMAMSSILLFAIIPTIGVARMNPYEALRGKITADVSKKSLLDYILFTKYLPQIPRIGIRNLSREKIRTLMTIISVMGALALSSALVATVNITDNQIPKSINESIIWDVEANFHTPVSEAIVDLYENLSYVEDVEPSFQFETMSTKNESVFMILEGQPWNSNMTNYAFKEGEGFIEKGSSECLINARIMNDLGLVLGDNITIWFYQKKLEFNIVGIVDSWSVPMSVIIQIDYLETILGPSIRFSAVRMIVEEGYEEKVVESLNDDDPNISFATTHEFFLKQMIEIVNIEQKIAFVAVVLGFIVAFIVIFNTAFISSLERIREFALMRAFGFSNLSIFLITEIENSILTPVAFIAGMILSIPISLIFLHLIEDFAQTVPYMFSWTAVWITMVFAIVTIFISAIPGTIYNINQELATSLKDE